MRNLKTTALLSAVLFSAAVVSAADSHTGFRVGLVGGMKNINFRMTKTGRKKTKDVTDAWPNISGATIGLNAGYVHDMGGFAIIGEGTFSYPMITGKNAKGDPDESTVKAGFSMQFSVAPGASIGNTLITVPLGFSMNNFSKEIKGVNGKMEYSPMGFHFGLSMDTKIDDNLVVGLQALNEMASGVKMNKDYNGTSKDNDAEKMDFSMTTVRLRVLYAM